MIRLLIWKTCFEILNLRRFFSSGKKTVQYFAFGANLDPKVLKRRKIIPLKEKEFVLRDHKLSFNHPSPWEGAGFASIEKEPGAKVYGKLYTLWERDARRLDYYELVPVLHRYQHITHEQDGEMFYYYQSAFPTKGLKPPRRYLDSILSGYKFLPSCPDEYVLDLKNTPAIENKELRPATDQIFFVSKRCLCPFFILKNYDQFLLRFFIRYLRDRSFTERWIHG